VHAKAQYQDPHYGVIILENEELKKELEIARSRMAELEKTQVTISVTDGENHGTGPLLVSMSSNPLELLSEPRYMQTVVVRNENKNDIPACDLSASLV